jgi:uncharacterized membrane protein
MTSLVLAAFTFAGLHLFVSGTRLRDALVARLGERAYRGLFSLASALALGWLILAYAKVRVPMPTPLPALKGPADLLLLVAFVLVVLGLATPGPTIVGAEKLLAQGVEARGIHRVTRHPFMWGVSLWALVHLVLNPEPAGLVFFGTFLGVACAGTFSIDHKRARLYGDAWARYAATTSNVPFAAIAQGRNRLAAGELGLWKVAIGVAAYAGFLLFHARFFGLPPF